MHIFFITDATQTSSVCPLSSLFFGTYIMTTIKSSHNLWRTLIAHSCTVVALKFDYLQFRKVFDIEHNMHIT